MDYHHFILETQMFHTMNFIVYCESKERALSKIKGWCDAQVNKTSEVFKGAKDHDYFVRGERKRWDTGLHNRQYMGVRVKPMRKPDVFIV